MSFERVGGNNPKIGSETPSDSSVSSQEIASLVDRLFGFYPPPDVADPKVFLAGVIAIMKLYPLEIVREVCGPTGYPSRHKFPPNNLAEIRSELEVAAAPWRRAKEREAIALEAARSLPPPVEDRAKRPSYEELQRRCHEVGLMIGPKGSRLPPFDAAAFRQKHGISKDQWDAIPNAK